MLHMIFVIILFTNNEINETYLVVVGPLNWERNLACLDGLDGVDMPLNWTLKRILIYDSPAQYRLFDIAFII